MTAKQFQNLLKKKHRAIIGAEFVLLLISAAIISMQYKSIENNKVKVAEYQQSMHDISNWHQAEYRAHVEAMTLSLLLTDAYDQGGIEKANELYTDVEGKAAEANNNKDFIKAELEKYGISSPDYFSPDTFFEDPPPVSWFKLR